MTERQLPEDLQQRQRALDTQQSFIVQAPAGAGKTELLTRRFLALLADVDNPEEILAITFTRKAAAEMQLRIIEALESSLQMSEPQNAFEKEGYELVMAANRRDDACGWNLLQNPARLRVKTIDAFCSGLVRQMPVLSKFGAMPQVDDNSDALYQQAADDMLRELLADDSDDELHKSLDIVLEFFDNVPNLRKALVEMLGKRDQWLRHLPNSENFNEARNYFEEIIQRETEAKISGACDLFPNEFESKIPELFCFAQKNLQIKYPEEFPKEISELESIPGKAWEDLADWKKIARFLLTDKSELRRTVNVKNGFPKDDNNEAEFFGINIDVLKSRKQEMLALLEDLKGHTGFIDALAAIRVLPDGGYREDQWRLLEAVTRLLREAVAWLGIVFRERNAVDFTEISGNAIAALGDETDPTELALSLEYRIRHLLVDEFQDTSSTQFRLFEKLVAGWQPGDGHTFFAVGDPMQSIYRFREAQVSLFIRAREQGINDLQLEPLTLSVNFRSREQIIDWVNETFAEIFPRDDNVHFGAVSYAASDAFRGQGEDAFVRARLLSEADKAEEADAIADICRDTLHAYPDQAIAILLRSRAQAMPIVSALQKAGIAYSAVEIETLQQRPVVRDILSVLKALLHPADRVHWLAVLRAPWCGLTLDDLYRLLDGEKSTPLWSLINDEGRFGSLSEDGRARLARLHDCFAPALHSRLQGSVAPWVQSIWQALGGLACIEDPVDFDAAELCFELIRELAAGGNMLDENSLDARLNRLYAPPSSDPEVRVQLMTIHKSKGLEFPTVILPGLDRKPVHDRKGLINWVELAGEREDADLLLAPIDETDEKEPILRMVLDVEKTKDANEQLRLLYVATTRARERLYLTACIPFNTRGEPNKPPKGSPLSLLRPVLEAQWSGLKPKETPNNTEPESVVGVSAPPLKRLPVDWRSPPPEEDDFHPCLDMTEPSVEEQSLEFLWAGDVARHVGTVIHRQLQRISEEGLSRWDDARVSASRALYEILLKNEGVGRDDLAAATARVAKSLAQALADQRGRWILDDVHEQAQSEFALTGVYQDQLVNIVIDRTFVDKNGERWIIDYKTGVHSGGGLDEFLNCEVERYTPQLNRYAELFARLEDRPIRLGLYFPMVGAWREWQA